MKGITNGYVYPTKLTKSLSKRLETLKEVKKIVTENTITIQSYGKLKRMGLCRMEEREYTNNQGYVDYEYTITLP